MRWYERVETPEGVFYRERNLDPDYEGPLITEAQYHAIKDKAMTGIVTGIRTGISFNRLDRDPF